MKLRYIWTAVISGALISATISAPVSAQVIRSNTGIVSPMYVIAKNPESTLEISGCKANCLSNVSGKSVVEVTAVQTLEKQDGAKWYPVEGASWESTVKSSVIAVSNTKSDLETGKYRLKTVFALTDKYGKTETVTIYSDTKTVA